MADVNQVDVDKIGHIPMNFVIGKERSGTTLLQVMLNAHPNIVAPPESRFMVLLYLKYGSKKKWTDDVIKSFCDDLFVEKLFKNYWNVDKQALYSLLVSVKEKLDYPTVCKLVFCEFAKEEAKEIKMFVDKNPLYYNFIPELRAIFPAAKFIHIVRDYRANILSHKRIATVNLKVPDMAYRWVRINEAIEAFKKSSPENWFTVKYESLVTDPENEMKKICVFLGIPFEKSMIEAHYTKLFPSFYQKNDEQFEKFHNRMFTPISSEFIDEWKEKMSKKDQLVAEYIAGDYGKKTYGYERYNNGSKPDVSSFKLFFVKLKYNATASYFQLLKHRWVYYTHRYFIAHVLHVFYRNKG